MPSFVFSHLKVPFGGQLARVWGLKQILPGAQHLMEFLQRMSPHVHMGKLRHKHVLVPQILPNMGYPCLAAKPFPVAHDTYSCPSHPKRGFPGSKESTALRA